MSPNDTLDERARGVAEAVEAFVAGGIKPRLGARAAALLEQAFLAGGNFLAFLLFARALTPAQWGEFGFAYALVLFVQGFQRAGVTIPMMAFATRSLPWAGARAAWAGTNAGVALLGLAALALAAGLAHWGPRWLMHSLALAALMLVPMLMHEFARRAAVQERRADLLAPMGAVYGVSLLLTAWPGLPWLLQAPGLGPHALSSALPALGVALGAMGATLVYQFGTRRTVLAPPAGLPAEPALRGFVGWAAASHLGYSGYNFGIQVVLGAVAGPAAVGVYHACRTLVQPVFVLITALDSIDKPRAAVALSRGGAAALRRALRKAMGVISAIALPYLLLVAAQADAALGLLYGDLYRGNAGVVLLWCLVALLSMVAQTVETGLYVALRTRELFYGRAVAALAALVAAALAVPLWGTAGALLATAIGYGLTSTLGSASLARLSERHTDS
jgi:O-antigen/teichoic acid export membrane protein